MASVQFRSVSKNFGEHRVLSDVSFEARPGEIVALMGENGAGKSTLMRILAGVYPHGEYSGEMRVDGRETRFAGVRDARQAGVAMIHQELGLFPELTVAENLLLDELRDGNPWRIRWNRAFAEAQSFLDGLGFTVDARAKLGELRTGLRQLVEIARALRTNASVLIMDEPTSALTEVEAQKLFGILGRLRAAGKAVFYVSHRMEEIARVSDRVVVLRDGLVAGIEPTRGLDRDMIIRWMVGREMANIYPARPPAPREGAPFLSVRGLTLRDRDSGRALVVDGVSFDVWPGEIVGMGGLMGAGRSETALALFGYFARTGPTGGAFEVSGTVRLAGQPARWRDPAGALAARVALLTEDRKGTGLFLNRPAAENMTIAVARRLGRAHRLGAIDGMAEHRLIKSLATRLKVRGPGLHADVAVYSGGNQQKVALAKCLALEPRLLILDEPTRGVDIGAKLEIYDILCELARTGVGIVLISSEMPELLGLSDRVLVLRQGAISAEFERADGYDPERILRAASL